MQRVANISKTHEMPQNTILEVKLFDVGSIDSMGAIVPSFEKSYIVMAVDCMS